MKKRKRLIHCNIVTQNLKIFYNSDGSSDDSGRHPVPEPEPEPEQVSKKKKKPCEAGANY